MEPCQLLPRLPGQTGWSNRLSPGWGQQGEASILVFLRWAISEGESLYVDGYVGLLFATK